MKINIIEIIPLALLYTIRLEKKRPSFYLILLSCILIDSINKVFFYFKKYLKL